MGFALQLEETLDQRHSQLESEFAAGADLGTILTRHLTAVESAAQTEMLTSILLLDESGRHLRHAAGPSLPRAYREAIDGGEIGPAAGSCGTAAFVGHPIYVSDIELDPLWAAYRQIALESGLRACWSTPIFNTLGAVMGTFAIYHTTPRSPTVDEVKAIALITDTVAQAIMFAREREARNTAEQSETPALKVIQLVPDRYPTEPRAISEVAALEQRLTDCASKLSDLAESLGSGDLVDHLRVVTRDCEALVDCLRQNREQNR